MEEKGWYGEILSSEPTGRNRDMPWRREIGWRTVVALFLFLLVGSALNLDFPGAERVRRAAEYAMSQEQDLTPWLKKAEEKLVSWGEKLEPAASQATQANWEGEFVLPVAAGRVVSSPSSGTFAGIIIETAAGEMVRAGQDGRVAVIKGDPETGYTVHIDHGRGWVSILQGCGEVRVGVEETVARGQVIGRMPEKKGSYPLLYYQVLFQGKPVNPLEVMGEKSP